MPGSLSSPPDDAVRRWADAEAVAVIVEALLAACRNFPGDSPLMEVAMRALYYMVQGPSLQPPAGVGNSIGGGGAACCSSSSCSCCGRPPPPLAAVVATAPLRLLAARSVVLSPGAAGLEALVRVIKTSPIHAARLQSGAFKILNFIRLNMGPEEWDRTAFPRLVAAGLAEASVESILAIAQEMTTRAERWRRRKAQRPPSSDGTAISFDEYFATDAGGSRSSLPPPASAAPAAGGATGAEENSGGGFARPSSPNGGAAGADHDAMADKGLQVFTWSDIRLAISWSLEMTILSPSCPAMVTRFRHAALRSGGVVGEASCSSTTTTLTQESVIKALVFHIARLAHRRSWTASTKDGCVAEKLLPTSSCSSQVNDEVVDIFDHVAEEEEPEDASHSSAAANAVQDQYRAGKLISKCVATVQRILFPPLAEEFGWGPTAGDEQPPLLCHLRAFAEEQQKLFLPVFDTFFSFDHSLCFKEEAIPVILSCTSLACARFPALLKKCICCASSSGAGAAKFGSSSSSGRGGAGAGRGAAGGGMMLPAATAVAAAPATAMPLPAARLAPRPPAAAAAPPAPRSRRRGRAAESSTASAPAPRLVDDAAAGGVHLFLPRERPLESSAEASQSLLTELQQRVDSTGATVQLSALRMYGNRSWAPAAGAPTADDALVDWIRLQAGQAFVTISSLGQEVAPLSAWPSLSPALLSSAEAEAALGEALSRLEKYQKSSSTGAADGVPEDIDLALQLAALLLRDPPVSREDVRRADEKALLAPRLRSAVEAACKVRDDARPPSQPTCTTPTTQPTTISSLSRPPLRC